VDGGGDGGDDGSDRGPPRTPICNNWTPQGYTMPPANLTQHSTPGVHEATEHHRGSMHKHLCRLMRQHLTVQLTLPHGTKTRKMDSDSIY
jgi:hypothetical protein